MVRHKLLPMLCLALIMVLCGCHENGTPVTESTMRPTTVATEPSTEAAEAAWAGYAGPADSYTYYYSEGRDLEWEEDVIYFAGSHLSDNLLLRNRKFLVHMPDFRSESRNFYDETIHEAVLDAVNTLIPEITNLSDNEILYRLQMISALFRDVHTSVYAGNEAVYPIFFMPIREGDEFVFYAVILPNKNEKLLYTRLTAINDIPVEEVVERIRPFVSYENAYGFYWNMGQGGYGLDCLSWTAALEAGGISLPGDEWAKYTLADGEGNTYELNMKATEDFNFSRCCGTTPGNVLSISYQFAATHNYWYSTALASGTLYVRIYSFVPNEEYRYMDLSNDLTLEYRAEGHFDKIILDLRGNGGGYGDVGWRNIINTLAAMEYDNFYILVDGGTYSNSMIFAAEVACVVPEAIFVGTPTGQAPGFFAGVYEEDYILPNSGIEIRIPTTYWQTFDANEENTLIPDVVIWPTIEDYRNCIDVVLEYVLAN